MTTLTLTDLRIAPVGDLTDTINVTIRGEGESVLTDAVVRRYAGGRDRIISRPGETRTVAFDAVNVARTDYLELQARLGTLQLFREPRGRRLYGVVVAVTADEWRARSDTLGQMSFTVTTVTYSEEV